jgi:hypothetical protein
MPSTQERVMLSKEVKRRRSLNRLLRKLHPHWKFCLIKYKCHQITLAKLQLRGLQHEKDSLKRQTEHQAISDHIARLEHDLDHMTKAEWSKEIEKISGRPHTSAMFREWAKIILSA